MCYIAYTQTDSLLPYFSKCSDFLCTNVDLCLSVNDNAEIRLLGLHKEMADKRKLQGEIERCIKKVVEGVDIFEDLWQKIYSTTNVNIKEKHEADLKKEIKKLQRLRDSIKNWLTSPEVKDKESLLEYKKLIEQQMERFKVVEKETKTKAYSKEGLGAMAKVDPKEKEKEAMLTWLSNSIENLKLQTDQIESEIEGLTIRKKKIDRDKQDQIELCKFSLERQKFHIGRLELVMRLVDNDALPIEQVQKIKEDVDYYVTSNRETWFEENEFIYDDLHLDEISATLGSKMIDALTLADDDLSTTLNLSDATSLPSSSCPSPTPSNLSHNTVNKDDVMRERKKSQSEDSHTPSSKLSTPLNSRPQHSTSSNNIAGRSLPFSVRSNNELQQPSCQPPNCVTGQNYAQVASLGVHNHQETNARSSKVDSAVDLGSRQDGRTNQKAPLVASPRLTQHKHQTIPTASLDTEKSCIKVLNDTLDGGYVCSSNSDNPATSNHGHAINDRTTENPPGSINSIDEFNEDRNFTRRIAKKIELEDEKIAPSSSTVPTFLLPATTGVPAWLSSISTSHAPPTVAPPTSQNLNGPHPPSAPVATAYSLVARPLSTQSQLVPRPHYNLSAPPPPMPSYHAGPSRVVKVDLPCMFGRKHLSTTENQCLDRMSAALERFPQPNDSRAVLSVRVEDYLKLRLEDHLHLRPFTHHVPSLFYRETIYHNLHSDTLFFIFYYMEGTLAQFLAAKALKNLSWRFHTKYFTWFQRMMDPSIITEEYEQGSYVYFDFVEWVQKNLDSFMFEYKYLEDKEL